MLVMHAPPLWIKPLVLYGNLSSLSPRIVSHRLTPAIKLLNPHYRRNSCRTIAMAAPIVDSSGESFPEHATGQWHSVPDLRLRDHRFTVPLDYRDPGTSLKISIFAREVVAGLSTPLTTSSMLQFKSARDLADYLKHFRADSIVSDAEFICVRLVRGSGPWTVLGRSYGGFCAVTYLSFAPQGLKQVLLTGGIPPIGDGCTADTVYGACFEQVARQNEKYYKRYPQDIEVFREVVNYLAESEGGGVPLPSGGILTPRGLQLLGLSGLGSSAGFERLHYFFGPELWRFLCHHHLSFAPQGLKQVLLTGGIPPIGDGCTADTVYGACFEQVARQNEKYYKRNPQDIEVVCEVVNYLAESEGGSSSIWGHLEPKGAATSWSFWFSLVQVLNAFIIFPGAPKKISFFFLNAFDNWLGFDSNPLYALIHESIDCQGASSRWSAQRLRAKYGNKFDAMKAATCSEIAGIRTWITNEYMHSGLRDAGVQVFDHSMGMLNGKRPLF
ncbi:hypothetical protein SLEP1_g10015 [Rubroshorea leprosula]|uniref:Proline iminopeptidase n=1 Tax=Rubroshorea leprosula TaxID=152421 RepID=A0AAV5IG15_9ROSI|nr:hypothetical protein SLEP1_g10015 [Rubroshorea leprosula]